MIVTTFMVALVGLGMITSLTERPFELGVVHSIWYLNKPCCVAGSAVSVFFFLNPELKPLGMHEGILGLIVHIPVLLTVSLRGTPQDDDHVEGYVNV